MLDQNINLNGKRILVTGAAGFIGSALVKKLLSDYPETTVIGFDNMNAYYDVSLKEYRLETLLRADASTSFAAIWPTRRPYFGCSKSTVPRSP